MTSQRNARAMTFFFKEIFFLGGSASQRQQCLKSSRCPLKKKGEKGKPRFVLYTFIKEKNVKRTHAEDLYTQKQKDRETTGMCTHIPGKCPKKRQKENGERRAHKYTHIPHIWRVNL